MINLSSWRSRLFSMPSICLEHPGSYPFKSSFLFCGAVLPYLNDAVGKDSAAEDRGHPWIRSSGHLFFRDRECGIVCGCWHRLVLLRNIF